MPKINQTYVVITTIFPPSEAIVRLAQRDDCQLIVAGDLKSPESWEQPGVQYLSADWQKACGHSVAEKLPWNHYCRKMVGYVEAIKRGAEVIIDTDDDNIPKTDWSFPAFKLEADITPADLGFVNIYRSFTDQPIWPRGLPLDRVNDPRSILQATDLKQDSVEVGIWQALADGDPDVDAIYRLTDNTPCIFDQRAPIVLAPGTLSPFNSQSTAFTREFFPLLYLPATVTFRFTDILRGLIAQPILWQHGSHLGFASANVDQLRNPHDYLKDFESEIPCYLHAQKVIDVVGASLRSGDPIADNLTRAYEALHTAEITGKEESQILEAWLADISGKESAGAHRGPSSIRI